MCIRDRINDLLDNVERSERKLKETTDQLRETEEKLKKDVYKRQLPDLPAPARAAGPDRHRSPAHMRETRWTGKPYQKKERPQRGAAPGFPFRPFRLKPKRSYRRRGTRQIATQTGCARRDRLDGTRFGR